MKKQSTPAISKNKSIALILELDAHYKTIEKYWMNYYDENQVANLDELDWSLSQSLYEQSDIDEASKLIERLKEICELAMTNATKQAEGLLQLG